MSVPNHQTSVVWDFWPEPRSPKPRYPLPSPACLKHHSKVELGLWHRWLRGLEDTDVARPKACMFFHKSFQMFSLHMTVWLSHCQKDCMRFFTPPAAPAATTCRPVLCPVAAPSPWRTSPPPHSVQGDVPVRLPGATTGRPGPCWPPGHPSLQDFNFSAVKQRP